jgi:hypothetical protein
VVSLIGLLMLLTTAPLFLVVEWFMIKESRPLVEMSRMGVTMIPADAPLAPANEGKLVFVRGLMTREGPVTDGEFGISLENALYLAREVEMYQWRENRVGYEKMWLAGYNASDGFREPAGHENPFYPQSTPELSSVSDKLDDPWIEARIGQVPIASWKLTGALDKLPLYKEEPRNEEAFPMAVHKGITGRWEGDWIYFGKDYANPEVGDLRARFTFAAEREYALIALQGKERLEDFVDARRHKHVILENSQIPKTAESVLGEEMLAMQLGMWLGRALFAFGILVQTGMIYWGAKKVLGGLSIVRAGGIAFTLLGSLALCLLIVALAWITFRPVLGAGLLILAGVLLSTLHGLGARYKGEEETLRALGRQ